VALLYCCINGSRDVQLVDTAAGSVIKTVTMGVGFQPFLGAVSPDGNWVAVLGKSSGSTATQLQYINCGTNTAVGSPAALGDNGGGLAWSANSGLVYVNCQTSMRSFDLSGVLQATVATPYVWGTGGAMAANSTHTLFYCAVGDTSSCHIATFNPAAGTFATPWPAPYAAGTAYTADLAVNGADSLVYVAAYDSSATPNTHLYTLTPTGTWGPTTPLALPGLGSYQMPTLAFSNPTAELYAAGFAGSLLVCDAGAAAVTATLTGFAYSQRPCVLRNGTQVWVANFYQNSHNSIQPVNPATHAVGAGINAESGVYAVLEAVSVSAVTVGPVTVTAASVITDYRIPLGPVTVAAAGTVPGAAGTTTVTVGPLRVAAAPVTAGTGLAAAGLGPVRLSGLGGRAGPGAWPVPGYRGAWRLTLHNRTFAPAPLMSTVIAELTDARGRQLVQAWNSPAQATFTLDGASDSAALIRELEQDVAMWRWDDRTGQDLVLFRGPITQSQDTLDEQSHVVTYTCHDYAALLTRRLVTPIFVTYTAADQDSIVADLLSRSTNAYSTAGASFAPASYFPLSMVAVNPGGSLRGFSGVTRNITYYGSQNVAAALDGLAAMLSGFDWDVQTNPADPTDSLRVFYPQQGLPRADYLLQYGANVATVARSVDSSDYANYVRVLGNSSSADPTAQKWSENWMYDAAHTDTNPVGTWMSDENAANVTVQDALDAKATGDVILLSGLQPRYTLGLTAGTYEYGQPNMGDVVQLVIQSGRLNVNTNVRVLGITYNIGDDGNEDVALTVGRPEPSLAKLFARQDRSIKALDQR
jgi:hypothetical protein